MKKRLLVISVDALVREDVEYLKTLPNYKKYIAGGCEITHVRTICPAVTYPVHSSIISGCYPDKTTVIGNCPLDINNHGEIWHWFDGDKKCDDLFREAKKAGYSTGAVFWPGTGKHPAIDYLIPEYKFSDDLEGGFREAGSSEEMLCIIMKNAGKLKPDDGGKRYIFPPYIDDFITSCAEDIIHTYAPEIFFIHNWYMDAIRHRTGIFNEEVTHGVELVDNWIGRVMHALEDVGLLSETNVVIMSDHGQMDYQRIIKPNLLLRDGGFLSLDEKGNILDHQAYAFSNGMSVYVQEKDPSDTKTHERLYHYLSSLAEKGIYGFTNVFTREEMREKEHLDGPFSFFLETDGYTEFSESSEEPLVINRDFTDYHLGKATHGFMPDLGPQPVFDAKGPDFMENRTLERREIIDLAPTWARILGISLPEADGKPITAFLR